MEAIVTLRRWLRADEDALADFRVGIASTLSLLAAVLLLPFGVYNAVFVGRPVLGGLVLATVVMLAVDTLAMRRGRPPPVPLGLLVLLLGTMVCASIVLQGVNGTYWAFPTLFVAYFVLCRRLASMISAALVVCATAAAVTLGWPVAARVGATLTLTLLMINVVLDVISKLHQALVEQAITDPLTGAFNRRHLATCIERLPREGDAPGALHPALLTIDIDHFKRINDRFGHDAGDAVLRRAVQLVSARKRSSDLLFRTGGEEFVLLLPAATPAVAEQVADELRARFEQAPVLPGEGVTVSIGVSLRRPGDSTEAWFKRADDALYDAKRGGRNRVVLAAAA